MVVLHAVPTDGGTNPHPHPDPNPYPNPNPHPNPNSNPNQVLTDGGEPRKLEWLLQIFRLADTANLGSVRCTHTHRHTHTHTHAHTLHTQTHTHARTHTTHIPYQVSEAILTMTTRTTTVLTIPGERGPAARADVLP